MTTIALQYGFRDPKVVYQHPDNADLRQLRPDPDVLYPGDVVNVPDPDPKKLPAATGAKHKYVVKSPPKRVLRLAFQSVDGKPLANADYTLSYGDQEISGTTDGDGMLEQLVPYDLDAASVLIDGDQHDLALGCLDPAKDTDDGGASGAQARLANLGYGAGDSGEIDDVTRAAIAAFQRDAGLTESGELDDATQAKLLEAHGC